MAAYAFIVVCFTLSVALWLRNSFIGTDGYTYATVGYNFIIGNGYTYAGIPHLIFHPLYPILIGLFSYLTDNLETAAFLASLFPYLVAVLLTYFLSGFFFKTEYQKWGSALLAGLHPKMLEFSTRIFSEMLFTVMLLLMIIGAFKLIEKSDDKKLFWVLVFGFAGGLAFLTRPEGLLYFAVLTLFILVRSPTKKTVSRTALASFTLLILALPWIIYLSSHFGYPTITGKGQINLAARGYKKSGDVKKFTASFPNPTGTRTLYEYPADMTVEAKIDHVPERYKKGIIHIAKDLRFFFGYTGLAMFFIGLAALLINNRDSRVLLYLFVPNLLFPLFIYPVEDRFLIPLIPMFGIILCSGWSTIGRAVKSKWNLNSKYQLVALIIIAAGVHAYWYVFISDRTLPVNRMHREIKEISQEIGKSHPEIQNGSIVARRGWVPFYLGVPHRYLPRYDTVSGLIEYMKRNELEYIYFQQGRDEKPFPQYAPLMESCEKFGLETLFEKGNHLVCAWKANPEVDSKDGVK